MAIEHYSKETIDKIGNAIIYLSERVETLSKTKLLKLLYLLEEYSVVKYHAPFFGIKFEVWQAGPVAKAVFIDLSDSPSLFVNFIETQVLTGGTFIKSKAAFNDDEFSDNDIEIMDYVISEHGNKTAKQLVEITHRESYPWCKAAIENKLFDLFKSGRINHSDIEVDFTVILTGCARERYLETKEQKEAVDIFKR
ncbi:putative phage-associated protein [Bacteroidales bacterium Barb6XT]|nr:putative phage-associated protein [Bacteroidales bacterium Barb6XT]